MGSQKKPTQHLLLPPTYATPGGAGRRMRAWGAQLSTSSWTTQLQETLGIHRSWVLVAMASGSHPKLLGEEIDAASHSPGEAVWAVPGVGDSQAAAGCTDGRPRCS